MKKILVTGSNGYLGRGIVKQLLDDGYHVIANDFNTENVDKRAICVNADLFSIDDPFQFFDNPDVMLHLAWKNGFIHNDVSHIEDLPKHYKFIKKMVDGGLKHIAVLGTMHEIGFFEGSINENTPTNPQSLYGIAKDALRKITALMCDNNDITYQWIRGFYIVGNQIEGSSIFSKIVQSNKRNLKLFPFTTGQNQWDFLDYDDFCLQVASIVEQCEVKGIINACSGYPEKLADRVERFIKENEFSIKLDYGKFPDRPYDSKAVWGDNNKINLILKKAKRD